MEHPFAKLRAPPNMEYETVMVTKTVLASCMAMVLLVGCKPKEAPSTETPPTTDAVQASAEAPAPAAQAPEAAPAAPVVTVFDITRIPASDKPLPAWPYVVLPAGYHYRDDDLASRSKDLARVPLWTGGQLLWLEGRTFSDSIRSDEGKTFSKFELRKNLQQAIEALGGARIGERSYDEAVYEANEKALDDFRQEFDRIRDAYWYNADADTYVIRRADKAIWVVVHVRNDDGGIMVAEGPLPPPAR